ncbi:thymidylate synthase [Streptomyces goshikiensis]|uniref:thymidylate synthase n=1 Tax=Streptomyces goshikiensis TaxID=1942 RepID=UPI0036BA6658
MLSMPSYPSLEGAYLALLRLATQNAEHHIGARGNDAREVIVLGFRLPDPRQRLTYLAERKANPVFHFAEALWYLAGRRDLAMIGYYAPSMRSSSPDGINLGGSAYGHTIFNPAPGDDVSQFDRVLELLRTEPDSKRALISVFSPDELADPGNVDVACVAGLHLLARDGQLHMVCTMRANDLDCGLLSDVFSFTVIQEYAAVQLGLELGTYTHMIGSAHVNDRNTERVERVLREAETRQAFQHTEFPRMPADTTAKTIATVLEHEENIRADKVRYTAADIAATGLPPYWQQFLLLFELYRQITHESVIDVTQDILAALDPGLRWLVGHRWTACGSTR